MIDWICQDSDLKAAGYWSLIMYEISSASEKLFRENLFCIKLSIHHFLHIFFELSRQMNFHTCMTFVNLNLTFHLVNDKRPIQAQITNPIIMLICFFFIKLINTVQWVLRSTKNAIVAIKSIKSEIMPIAIDLYCVYFDHQVLYHHSNQMCVCFFNCEENMNTVYEKSFILKVSLFNNWTNQLSGISKKKKWQSISFASILTWTNYIRGLNCRWKCWNDKNVSKTNE